MGLSNAPIFAQNVDNFLLMTEQKTTSFRTILRLSPLYEWVYETAGKDHYVSVDKLQKQLSWRPKKTTADVWIDTYRWYLEEYKKRKIETGVSHRVAWKQGILKLAKLFF